MLCLLANVSSAQIASTDYSIPTEIYSFSKTKKVSVEDLEFAKMMAEKHTESAEKQLKNYLSLSLKYSEILIENGVEGKVRVAFNIASNGTIRSYNILESPHPEVTKMVKHSLQNLTRLTFKDQWYHGLAQLEIPLQFSLR